MSVTDSFGHDAEQKNKRHNVRSPLIVEKIPCDDGMKTFFGYAKNISRGGLFIATVKPREPGEEFILQMSLPTTPRHTFSCRCRVVWKRHFLRKDSHEPGMGLRFLDLADIDGDRIDLWVNEQTARLSGSMV